MTPIASGKKCVVGECRELHVGFLNGKWIGRTGVEPSNSQPGLSYGTEISLKKSNFHATARGIAKALSRKN